MFKDRIRRQQPSVKTKCQRNDTSLAQRLDGILLRRAGHRNREAMSRRSQNLLLLSPRMLFPLRFAEVVSFLGFSDRVAARFGESFNKAK
jgi:hypothetical protein